MKSFDIILVGGGLANGLIACRVAEMRGDLDILLIEAGPRIGANHTWSYHQTDLRPSIDQWMAPIARYRWDGQEVRFPRFHRHLDTGYRTVLPDDLHRAVASRPSVKLMLSTTVTSATATSVTIAGGLTFHGNCVIDGRGLGEVSGLSLGYQTFLGHEIEMVSPHGVERPVIMDAAVTQHDGYRFVYLLPMTPTRLLVEDTYYADSPSLDTATVAKRIHAYVKASGWQIASVERTEQGLLPIVLDGRLDAVWPQMPRSASWSAPRSAPRPPARSGMRAGLFHQTTGYSLPLSAQLADAIAALPAPTTPSVERLARRLAEDTWSKQFFFRMLNRLLFIAAHPEERRGIMQRFYGLDAGLIERFYAGNVLAKDMARILVGKPPIPIPRAIGALAPRAADGRRAILRRPSPTPLAS